MTAFLKKLSRATGVVFQGQVLVLSRSNCSRQKDQVSYDVLPGSCCVHDELLLPRELALQEQQVPQSLLASKVANLIASQLREDRHG